MRVVIANCYPDDTRGSAAQTDGACAMTGAALRAPFRHSLAAHPRVAGLPPVLQTRRAAGLAEAGAVARGLLWQLAPARLGNGAAMPALRGADVVLSRGGYLLAD